MSVTVTTESDKYPDGWYTGAYVCEWNSDKNQSGCELNGLWNIELPFRTDEEKKVVLSINRGDTLELTDSRNAWSLGTEYTVELLGVDQRKNKRIFFIRKKI